LDGRTPAAALARHSLASAPLYRATACCALPDRLRRRIIRLRSRRRGLIFTEGRRSRNREFSTGIFRLPKRRDWPMLTILLNDQLKTVAPGSLFREPDMQISHGKLAKNACALCSAIAYCCGAVALALPLPSLGVSSLDLGRLHASGPFFLPERNNCTR